MQTIEEKRAYNRSRYWRQREAALARARAYAAENKDRTLNNYLLRNYGVTKLQYDEMRIAQNFACAICGRHEKDLGYRLRVDHCHVDGYDIMSKEDKSMYVRGLLCDTCNLGIGYFDDNIAVLEVAKSYLAHYRDKEIGVPDER